MSYNLLDNVTLSGASSYTYSNFNITSSSTAGPYWAWEFRFHDITNGNVSNYYPQLQATASLNIPYTVTYNAFTSANPYNSGGTGSSWIALSGYSDWNVPSNGKLLIEQPKRNGTSWYCNFQSDWTYYDSAYGYGYSHLNSFGVFTDYTSIDEITIKPNTGTWYGGISVYGIAS